MKLGKYWICRDCANKKGWVEMNEPHTVCEGTCSWCNKKNKVLVPERDFNKKNGKKK